MNYSFVPFGRLIWIFVYVLAVETFAGQAGLRFKTVCQKVWKNNLREFEKIWLLLLKIVWSQYFQDLVLRMWVYFFHVRLYKIKMSYTCFYSTTLNIFGRRSAKITSIIILLSVVKKNIKKPCRIFKSPCCLHILYNIRISVLWISFLCFG